MILGIIALVAVLWIRIFGHGFREVEIFVSIMALYAAYDGHRKAREAKMRAEMHVTPPGDGPAGMAR